MKKWHFKPASGILLVVFFCLVILPAVCRAEVAVLARVGGEAITSPDLQDILQPGESEESALEKLVEERLLFLEAKKQKVEISKKEIDGEYERIMRLFPDPVSFYRKLKEESLSPAALRQRIERQLMARRFVQNEISAKIKITPRELESYLQEHRDELIRRESDFRLSEAVYDTREEIPAKISDLEPVLKDLGFIPFRKLSEQIQEVLLGLKVGEFSPVIFFKNTYTIFKLTDIKPPAEINQASLALTAKQDLFRENFIASYQKLITRLKSETEIKYYLEAK